MYLWNADALVEDFQHNNVSSAEEFKYFFVNTLYIACISHMSLISLSDSNEIEWYDSVYLLITLLINAIGCYANYRLNQHGDDKDFIKRCLCLGVPLGIKLNTLAIILLFLLFLFIELAADSLKPRTIDFISYVGIIWPSTIVFYYFLARKLEAIAYYKTPTLETTT
jgi:hypothetical protein